MEPETKQVIKFEVEERAEFSIVKLTLLVEALEPSVLATLEPPQVDFTKGVVISGRGPIWLYANLTHHYHPAAWTGTHDPRLGVIVTATHSKKVTVGQVLPL